MNKPLYFLFLAFCIQASAIDIIRNGVYYTDLNELKIENQEEWYAIIKKADQYEVKKMKISVKKVDLEEHGLADENDLTISSHPDAMILLRGTKLKEGPIKTGKGGEIGVGKALDLGFDNFKMFATGKVTYHENEYQTRYLKIENYEIFVRKDGVNILLLSAKEMHDGYSVSWVGDINSDGYPDFMIWTDVYEKSSPDSLYMSEKGDGQSPVKYIYVGAPQYQGC